MTVIHEEQAIQHIHGICLKTGPPRRVGVELEWLVRDARNPALPVPAERIAAAVSAFGAGVSEGDSGEAAGAIPRHSAGRQVPALPSSSAPGVLPSGATLTTEPGGQLELSSLPADSLADCVRSTVEDLTALRAAAADAGLELAGFGLDPFRPPRRILHLPRYAAMEAFFDRGGPWGRQMMCATASVQVCLDAGDEGDGPSGYRWRWRLLHTIGPVLVAAFANSPLRRGRPTGWRSSRQQIWAHMDPGRTRPPELNGDPRADWAAYALDAQVMCVRDDGSGDWTAPPGLTLRDWVRGGAVEGRRLRPPTTEDLVYHLSTLFPPVRPRGHFELRMIDAQPGDGWVVPAAVTSALLGDTRAGETAMAACERLWSDPDGGGWGDRADWGDNPWLVAARRGPSEPMIAQASRECFAAAREALVRHAAPVPILDVVDAFIEQYVAQDRCPADDILEEVGR
ncbi:MAG TPA: ergothioneine biosynthesis glutamate--cysteine ligase EgtA [Trebonia sp.]|jgi:ergothioneine biosynthesis glutamate--cysteine ligase EgtA|nr:ergothioneine biosynthesis glutamate--cysteine ligase EgtA [Trebonia sp.]